MTELEIWNLLKKRALETDLDWAIFYYKEEKVHFLPCTSDPDIDRHKIRENIHYGIPHLIVHIYKSQKNLTFNGIEVMAVDIVEDGEVKAVCFNSDYLRKKQRRPTKEELIASVEELEGALRGKIKSEYKKD